MPLSQPEAALRRAHNDGNHTIVRLIVFDCDGTLVDSQAGIVACAQAAFRAEGLPPPPAEAVRRIVGLSLTQAMQELAAGAGPHAR